MSTEATRLQFLDALRGLAALAVVVFHVPFVGATKLAYPAWAADFILFGATGVTLFFVISAFSLCLTMPRHEGRERPLLSFYVSRYFRIAPLFYLMIVLFTAKAAWDWHALKALDELFFSFTFLFNLVPGKEYGFVTAGWTISIEMIFYAFFPIFYLARIPLRLILLAASISLALLLPTILVALEVSFNVGQFHRYTVLRHLPIFLTGMLAFDVYKLLHSSKRSQWVGELLLIFGFAGCALIATNTIPGHGWRYYILGGSYALILLGLSLLPLQILVNRITAFFGAISYSVYLLHSPIIYAISPVHSAIYEIAPSTTVAFSLSVAVSILAVTPIAWLSYKYVELPGIELGRQVYRRWSSSSSRPEPTPVAG